jgi:hypothetical protein
MTVIILQDHFTFFSSFRHCGHSRNFYEVYKAKTFSITKPLLPAKCRTVNLHLSLHEHTYIAVCHQFLIYLQSMTVSFRQTSYKSVFTFSLALREDGHDILQLICKILPCLLTYLLHAAESFLRS